MCVRACVYVRALVCAGACVCVRARLCVCMCVCAVRARAFEHLDLTLMSPIKINIYEAYVKHYHPLYLGAFGITILTKR